MSETQITQDAEQATELILAGLPLESPSGRLFKDRVRQAYLLGRADQAAKNLDDMITTFRKSADAHS